MRASLGLVVVSVWSSLWTTIALAAPGAPIPVSPGAETGVVLISQSCPTFSWEAAAGASWVDLVVYRLPDEVDLETGVLQARPLIERRLPGGATGWTPSLALCLEKGGRYAWSIRAGGPEGDGEWASPSLFELTKKPSLEEVEEALRVLKEHFAGEDDDAPPGGTIGASGTGEPLSVPLEVLPVVVKEPAPRAGAGVVVADLDVEGTIEGDVLRLSDTGANFVVWEMSELANNDMVINYFGEVARFTMAGDFGIGTGATVDEKLHVNGTAQVNVLRLEDTVGNGFFWDIAEVAGNALRFDYSGVERFTVSSGGNVTTGGTLTVGSLSTGVDFLCRTASNVISNCGANPIEEVGKLEETVEAQRLRIEQLERALGLGE